MQQCKIARILVWDGQEQNEIDREKCEKEYEVRARVNDGHCVRKRRCRNEIEMKLSTNIEYTFET